MNIIVFLVVGLIAGWLSGKIVEGHGFGTLGDVVIGIAGAFIGGLVLNSRVPGDATTGFWEALAISTVGAVVLLVIAHILRRLFVPHAKGV